MRAQPVFFFNRNQRICSIPFIMVVFYNISFALAERESYNKCYRLRLLFYVKTDTGFDYLKSNSCGGYRLFLSALADILFFRSSLISGY